MTGIFQEEVYSFPPGQRATVPGGPASPPQAGWRRALYAVVGLLLGVSGGLGNGLVSANLPYLLGALGAETREIAWVPTAYSMTYICMNLLLVRFRQQFGLRLFAMLALIAFCTVAALHVLVRGVGGAVLVHAAAGIATAPMTTLSVYYLMAALGPKVGYRGVIIGLGLSQIATPLARAFSSELLAIEQWRALYLFELGLGLLCLGSVTLLRLPPSQRVKAFEPLDFVTYPLMAVGLALICAVLGLGRYDWWLDAPWLGWALAAAVPLLGLAVYIETNRASPLLDLRWLGGATFIRFAVVVTMSRVVLSEQNTSAIGLLSLLGVDNEELHLFSLALVAASIAGIAAAAYLFKPDRITELAALAIGLVAVGAFLDAQSTDLTRVSELYASQVMIAFATTLFIGPAMLFGIAFVLKEHARTLPSFLVLFVVAQNLGSLIGSALLGTFQIVREKAVSVPLYSQLDPSNAVVASHVRRMGGSLAALHREAAREANILAYNNTFLLVAVLAALTTLYLAFQLFIRWRRHLPLSSAAAALQEIRR